MRLSRAFPLGSAGLVALQIVISGCGSTTAGPVTANAGVYRDATSYVGALGGRVVLGDGSLRGAVRIDTGLLSVTSTVTSGVVTASSGNLSVTGTRVTTSKVSTTTSTSSDGGSTSCTSATTCGGHGTCDASGSCTCNAGFSGPTCQ